MPMNWERPTVDLVLDRLWNKSASAALFPPKIWGVGWSYNFAYPLIKEKPLWKRVFAFALGLAFILLVIYVLVVLCVLLYYAVTPQSADVMTITLTEAGPIVT
jgi:hypothetical protein